MSGNRRISVLWRGKWCVSGFSYFGGRPDLDYQILPEPLRLGVWDSHGV